MGPRLRSRRPWRLPLGLGLGSVSGLGTVSATGLDIVAFVWVLDLALGSTTSGDDGALDSSGGGDGSLGRSGGDDGGFVIITAFSRIDGNGYHSSRLLLASANVTT